MEHRRAILVGIVLFCLGAGAVFFPIEVWFESLLEWLAAQGQWGYLGFGLVYFGAGMACLPMFPIGVLAGATYGLWSGWLVLMPGALVAAILAGFLGRSIFRGAVLKLVSGHRGWQAICGTLADQGIRAVVLNRMAPVMPFAMQNYALAAIGVSPRALFIGTLLGMQPALWAALYSGHVLRHISAGSQVEGRPDELRLALLFIGLVAIITLVVWLKGVAQRAMSEPDST